MAWWFPMAPCSRKALMLVVSTVVSVVLSLSNDHWLSDESPCFKASKRLIAVPLGASFFSRWWVSSRWSLKSPRSFISWAKFLAASKNNWTPKRKWWVVFAVLPGFSLFLYAHLIGEICDSYRKYSFWEHNGAVLLGWVLLPYWGWSKDVSYHGIGGVAKGERVWW